MLLTKQYELGAPLSELPPLTRKATGLIEFHCVLLTRYFLDAIGGRIDESIQTTRGHVDLCLLADLHGTEVYFEPASRVRYENSRPVCVSDIDFFMFRWDELATTKTISHFEQKVEGRSGSPARENYRTAAAGLRTPAKAQRIWLDPSPHLESRAATRRCQSHAALGLSQHPLRRRAGWNSPMRFTRT